MRICDVNNFYSPTGGGVRIYHDRKVEFFAARPEHAHALVVPSDRWRCTRTGSTTRYEIPAVPMPGGVYRYTCSTRYLRRVVEDFHPDLIEVGSPYLLPHLTRRAARGHAAAIVGYYHADFPHAYLGRAGAAVHARLRDPGERLGRWYAGRVYRSYDATLCASAYAADRLAQAGVPAALRVPLGVDTTVFRPQQRAESVRADLGIEPDQTLVIHTGRLHAEKNVREMFAGWCHAPSRTDARLVILLHGPLAPWIRQQARGRDDVVTLDYVPQPERLAGLLASADLALSLSRHDTFSLGTLEAMACGTPTVTVAGSAAAELTEACTGGLALADVRRDSLAHVFRETPAAANEATRRVLHERVASRYSWRATFELQVEAYARVLATRTGRTAA
jgi:alpha-1,6-mannosyltransferase